MAGVKISQLQDGGALQAMDAFPVARGSLTRKILGAQLLDPLQSLDTRLNALSSNTIFVVDSPTIDLSYNSSTRTLSADASYLLSLINTLSSDMKLEPALSKTYAGQFTTPQIVTSSPAVLYGCNIMGGAGNGEGQARIFSNNEMKMVAYEYTPGSQGDFVFDRGVDCPNGIQITLNTTCSAVVYYNLK